MCRKFQCPNGLELLLSFLTVGLEKTDVSMPSRAWVVTDDQYIEIWGLTFQCPHGLELLRAIHCIASLLYVVSMPSRAWVVTNNEIDKLKADNVSMPSRAWVVTICNVICIHWVWFQCPLGLELLRLPFFLPKGLCKVSMPSRAWVVTARMSNILNFLWYFLCIPAIYKCILAYLSIFFNQLSEFLRCESPSTFLGTCLSHHSFIWW